MPVTLTRGRSTPLREVRYILLADDHPIVLAGLRGLLEQEPDLSIIGTVRTSKELFVTLEAIRPSLLILDLSLGKADGLDVLKSVRAIHERLAVLVFSMHDERDFALRVVNAGAMGYLMKDNAAEQMVAAVRAVLGGQVYLSEAVLAGRRLGEALDGEGGVDGLTDRELSIFRMIGKGMSTREIAEDLHLSVKTVEKHRENIKRKLGIDGGSKLAAEAAVYVWRSAGGETSGG